jgi:hypothetical protein
VNPYNPWIAAAIGIQPRELLYLNHQNIQNIIQSGYPPGQPPKPYGVVTALLTASGPESTEPKSYKEAMKDPNWKMWKAAVGREFDSLEENKT